MTNEDLRREMRANKIYNWQVAHVLGVCEQTIIRWFRLPMSEEQLNKVSDAIERIKAGGVQNA